tara:strand:+ start:165 stop:749 length:585 start_codon:yes stop_codon:yes gene_type:complete
MFGFHAISEAPFSEVEGGIINTASLSGAASLITVSLKSSIGSGSPFDSGFNIGYESGSRLRGTATITQNLLSSSMSLVATPTIISGDVVFTESLSLQSSTSFGANSVLLIGPSSSIAASLFSIQAVLSGSKDQADSALFTLHLDKEISLPLNVYKGIDIASQIDKQSDYSSYIDKAILNTGHIDKSVEQTLTRE